MLTVFTRAIIIYLLLLFAMRLMGKRQLGELQPFEFAITMIAAELACIPMAETAIPISYGLIPIFSLFILHLFITKLATRSIRFRSFLNGKPVIVMDKDGICTDVLKKVDMNINDLLDALRGSGYFDLSTVAFAILETNGTLSVLPRTEGAPLTPDALTEMSLDGLHSLPPDDAILPYTLVVEGHIMSENIALSGHTEQEVVEYLHSLALSPRDVMVLTLSDTDTYIQPVKGNAMQGTFGATE